MNAQLTFGLMSGETKAEPAASWFSRCRTTFTAPCTRLSASTTDRNASCWNAKCSTARANPPQPRPARSFERGPGLRR